MNETSSANDRVENAYTIAEVLIVLILISLIFVSLVQIVNQISKYKSKSEYVYSIVQTRTFIENQIKNNLNAGYSKVFVNNSNLIIAGNRTIIIGFVKGDKGSSYDNIIIRNYIGDRQNQTKRKIKLKNCGFDVKVSSNANTGGIITFCDKPKSKEKIQVSYIPIIVDPKRPCIIDMVSSECSNL